MSDAATSLFSSSRTLRPRTYTWSSAASGFPGDKIHLEHGIVYLNGVAQNEPYAAMPRSDGDLEDAYIPYRDDFPADLSGIEEQASATTQRCGLSTCLATS